MGGVGICVLSEVSISSDFLSCARCDFFVFRPGSYWLLEGTINECYTTVKSYLEMLRFLWGVSRGLRRGEGSCGGGHRVCTRLASRGACRCTS